MGCGNSIIENANLKAKPSDGQKHKLFLETIYKFECAWCSEKGELDAIHKFKNCYYCGSCDLKVCKRCYEEAVFNLQFEVLQEIKLKCLQGHKLLIKKYEENKGKGKEKLESFTCNGCVKFGLKGYSLCCTTCEYSLCMKCVNNKEESRSDMKTERDLIKKSYDDFEAKNEKIYLSKKSKRLLGIEDNGKKEDEECNEELEGDEHTETKRKEGKFSKLFIESKEVKVENEIENELERDNCKKKKKSKHNKCARKSKNKVNDFNNESGSKKV